MSIANALKNTDNKRGMMSVSEAGKKGGEARGKIISGGINPNAKLNPKLVREIRELKGIADAPYVAKEYKISETHVYRIWRYVCWKETDEVMRA